MHSVSQPLRQSGSSLVTTLIMLVAVASLAGVSARLALSGERSSRGDRDREVAFQAAEAALLDAEMEIMGPPDRATRGGEFCATGNLAFPLTGCIAGSSASDRDWGKCATMSESQPTPSWLSVNWEREGVVMGTFTGTRAYPTGTNSWLPYRPPRYIIEKSVDLNRDVIDGFANKSGPTKWLYQITAIGYGSRPETSVVLQSVVRPSEVKTACFPT